ncbi:MAG: hypothetical protein KY397_03675 [Gemmatimonadetes bacterium]|nr:hypothetical protein [Gemmatimonadota bacterium]
MVPWYSSKVRLVVPFLIHVAVACGSETPEAEVPAAVPGVESGETERSEAAPSATPEPEDAELTTLVHDIRRGIAGIPGMVGESPDSARQSAVELYVSRQEVIEAGWGPRAGEDRARPVALAVDEAEHRFHELMEVLSVDPPPDSIAVAAAVESLDQALVDILREAEAEGPGE